MSAENFILISELEEFVRMSKSHSSARNYLSMLRLLHVYLNDDAIDVRSITAEFVKSFGESMSERDIAPSTIKLYKQMLRALLNKQLGKGSKDLIKSAFKGISSNNETATRLLRPEDVITIAHSGLNRWSLLKKARDVFMFSFYGGGITLEELKSLASDNFASIDLISQQKDIVQKFQLKYDIPFYHYIIALSEDDYRQRLGAIAELLKLKASLTPQSSADAWVKAARKCGLNNEIIISCLRTATNYLTTSENNQPHPAEYLRYYQDVANTIYNIVPRWYVMRCHDISPAELSKRLNNDNDKSPISIFDTFVPVQQSDRHRDSMNEINDMLFFRSSPTSAVNIKKNVWPDAFVYSNRSTGQPSFIPDDEMRIFMLLSNIASDTIEYYFPDVNSNTQEFNPDDRVTVTDGNFCGQVGIIKKLSNDRLKVFIKIEALNGAIVTAEIHKSFLKVCEN